MMAPAVGGTKNVLEACSAANVQKLVVVSSAATVCLNPTWPEDKIKDETCWSDKELCKQLGLWYCVAKIQAEEMALEYGEQNGLHVVTVLPGVVVGPLLQNVVLNTTMKVLRYIITGGPDTMNNKFWPLVHVHDVANALLLAYHKAEALVHVLTVDVDYKVAVSSDKLRSLGWKPRSLEETLVDGLEYLEKAGLLKEPCRLPYFYRVTAGE